MKERKKQVDNKCLKKMLGMKQMEKVNRKKYK